MSTIKPPGEVIRELLEERKITQTLFAKSIMRQRTKVSEIIIGKRAITADTAERLETFFGKEYPAMYWLVMQAHYDLSKWKQNK